MADSKRQLAELYQCVVQNELGLDATIEEDGDVLFEHPEMGGFFISLSVEVDPGYMRLALPSFCDVSGFGREDLMRICNTVNVGRGQLATLTVHEAAGGNVCSSVTLLLAPPGRTPDEVLIRGVIHRAFSSVRSAAEDFFRELASSNLVRRVSFQELYKKFLEIYWDEDITNALQLGYKAREAHQTAVDSDISQPETIYSFAAERSIEISGRVDHFYDHEDGRTVYLEKVFIVAEGTNALRFEFGGRISYPLGVTVPCELGGTYSFSGRIGSADYSWSFMNPRHIYAPYGFKNDVTFLCLDVSLDDAICVRSNESAYTGRSFGLSGGDLFRPKRRSR